jgi:hypothetical protein
MPDPVLILEALAAAAVTAAAVLLLCGWPWRSPRPTRVSVGCVLGVGLGFYAGCGWLGLRPHWPPREDQDRLLLLLFPALLGVELLAALSGRLRWLEWLPRLVVVVAAARVLLHDSTYLADLSGPDTREWTPAQTWLILGGLAAALAGVWALLALLSRRAPGRSVPLAVALACAGAAVTVMLSGYASGGQMGLPLAAALVGTIAASLALSGPSDLRGVLGPGVVGLFALLVVGRFFGELTTGNAALLFLAPLLCWLPELPRLSRMGSLPRGLGRVVLTAVPVAIALLLAQQKFVADSAQSSPGSKEISVQDYLDFGK